MHTVLHSLMYKYLPIFGVECNGMWPMQKTRAAIHNRPAMMSISMCCFYPRYTSVSGRMYAINSPEQDAIHPVQSQRCYVPVGHLDYSVLILVVGLIETSRLQKETLTTDFSIINCPSATLHQPDFPQM